MSRQKYMAPALMARLVASTVSLLPLLACSELRQKPIDSPDAGATSDDKPAGPLLDGSTRPSESTDAALDVSFDMVLPPAGAVDAAADRLPNTDGTVSPETQANLPEGGPPAAKVEWLRASVASDGTQANGPSSWATISGDGRYVVFTSVASNLVPADSNNLADIFRFDRLTKKTVRVNVAASGAQANGFWGQQSSTTSDGRYVLFVSSATNLVPSDTNAREDVFLRDLDAGTTTRLSTNSAGNELQNQTAEGALASQGRYAAFVSSGVSEVVPGVTSRVGEAYRKDLQSGEILHLSTGGLAAGNVWISPDGNSVVILGSEPGNEEGVFHFIDIAGKVSRRLGRLGANLGSGVRGGFSKDGRLFAFDSWADQITGVKRNQAVFTLDRNTWRITLVSDANNGSANGAFISADGDTIAFSQSAGLVHLRPRILNLRTQALMKLDVGNASVFVAGLSENGETLVVSSTATDLIQGDTNNVADVFVSAGSLQ